MSMTIKELEDAVRSETGDSQPESAPVTEPDDEKEEETETVTETETESDETETDSDEDEESEDDESEGDSDEGSDDEDESSEGGEDAESGVEEPTEDTEKPEKESDKDESEEVKAIRRKLLSQVSQKEKIADKALSLAAKAMSSKGKSVTVDDMRSLMKAEIAKEDARKALAKEERKFFGQNSLAAKYREEVKAVKSEFGKLSWDASLKLVLAERDPSALVNLKGNKRDALPSNVQAKKEQPKETDPKKMSDEDLKAATDRELRTMLGLK